MLRSIPHSVNDSIYDFDGVFSGNSSEILLCGNVVNMPYDL